MGEGHRACLDLGAHAVELEVDVETGVIDIIKIALALIFGQVISEQMVYSQIIGGVMQGVGSAILDRFSPTMSS